MKIAPFQNKSPMVDRQGIITPIWQQWLNHMINAGLREVKDSSVTPDDPAMKKGEFIVLKQTHSSLGRVYLVYYDGTNHHYWLGSSSVVNLGNDVWIFTNAGPPDDGPSGTAAGEAGPGSMLIDYVNGTWYRNTNTKTSPLWLQCCASDAST